MITLTYTLPPGTNKVCYTTSQHPTVESKDQLRVGNIPATRLGGMELAENSIINPPRSYDDEIEEVTANLANVAVAYVTGN